MENAKHTTYKGFSKFCIYIKEEYITGKCDTWFACVKCKNHEMTSGWSSYCI